MLTPLRRHARHNVVSYLALFVALTGTAYAAGPLKAGDPAGGDLRGVYPDPVIKPCAPGQLLKHDGTAWNCAEDVDTGLSGYEVISASAAPGARAVEAQCSPGKKVIGGGAATSSGLFTSAPVGETGWGALSSPDATGVTAYAICAHASR